jgi:hypothetical protein
LRQFRELRKTETILTLEDAVMHLPKVPVGARELRRLGCGLRHGMNLSQRKMPVNKSQLLAEMLSDGVDDRMRLSTMGTLVITVLDQSYRGVLIAEGVVSWPDGYFQFRHDFVLFLSYSPALPEFHRHRG